MVTDTTLPPQSPLRKTFLRGVTCASASDCWAVGNYLDLSNGTGGSLIQRWNGTSWTVVSSPNSLEPYNILTDVTCTSASNCWAVGDYSPSSATGHKTLIERWDGTAWAIVSSPNATSGPIGNILNNVACASDLDCWVVGSSFNGDFPQTLIERYAMPLQLPSVASRKVHSGAGTFDVDLPLTGSPGVECRSGGANGNHTIIFSFASTLTSVGNASVTSGTGSVASRNIDSSDAHRYIVNLTGVTNAQIITVRLTNVTDSTGSFTSFVPASMGVLIGDSSGNKTVSNTDVAAVKGQVSAPVTAANFRTDVNANGIVSNTDVSVTKAQVSTSLP